MSIRLFGMCALAFMVSFAGAPAGAEVEIDPASPFRLGEGYADEPATCETVADWIGRAPQTNDRITMTVTGELVASEWDGALAYLIMCPAAGVQVMCVTYSNKGRAVGDKVLFAGGYTRVGERQVMLDPCLAAPRE